MPAKSPKHLTRRTSKAGGGSPRRGAGAAFAEHLLEHPEDAPGVRRALEKLRVWKRALTKLRPELATSDAEWERTFGVPCPKNIDDLQRLAVRAGIDPNVVLKGEWREADVMPLIEGAMQRLADEAKGSEMQAKTGDKAKRTRIPVKTEMAILCRRQHPEWTDKKIAECVGIRPESLSRSHRYQTEKRQTIGAPNRTAKTAGGGTHKPKPIPSDDRGAEN